MNESLLYEHDGELSAEPGNSGYFGICPIGQRDSIDLVLKGLDYRLVDIATDAVVTSFSNLWMALTVQHRARK